MEEGYQGIFRITYAILYVFALITKNVICVVLKNI